MTKKLLFCLLSFISQCQRNKIKRTENKIVFAWFELLHGFSETVLARTHARLKKLIEADSYELCLKNVRPQRQSFNSILPWEGGGGIIASSMNFELLPWQQITEGTSQDLAPRKSEKSAICQDIELKFGIETNFGPLSSKNKHKFPIRREFDVIMTFLTFRPLSTKTQK